MPPRPPPPRPEPAACATTGIEVRSVRMKRILAAAAIFLALTSCGLHAPADWADTPNPLDTPDIEIWVPESEGDFGHEWMDRR